MRLLENEKFMRQLIGKTEMKVDMCEDATWPLDFPGYSSGSASFCSRVSVTKMKLRVRKARKSCFLLKHLYCLLLKIAIRM